MKKIILYLVLCFAFIFSACSFAYPQGGGQLLRQKCPAGTGNYQTFQLLATGSQAATTCAGGTFTINGGTVPTASGTANYFPLFTGASTLGNSALRYTTSQAAWDGFTASTLNLYELTAGTAKVFYLGNPTANINFLKGIDATTSREANVIAYSPSLAHYGYFSAFTDNTYGKAAILATTETSSSSPLFSVISLTGSSDYKLQFKTDLAAGHFKVGDYTNTPTNYLSLDQTTNSFAVNTVSNINLVSTTANISFSSGLNTEFVAEGSFNVATVNGNATFDVSAGNDNFTVTTGTGTTTFTTNQFRISDDLAFANATACIAEANLDVAGVFDIAGAGNPCYSNGDYVFTTGITATGSLRVSALGVVTSSAGAGDAVQSFRYWIIKRY